MKCVKRRSYVVDCNWKFLMENTCETYHTSVVHKQSLGPMKAKPVGEHIGNWDAVLVPSKRSVYPTVRLWGSKPVAVFTNNTAFITFSIITNQYDVDCCWFMRLIPLSVDRQKLRWDFAFQAKLLRQQTYSEYLKRWHLAVSEDNAISLNQRKELSPFTGFQGAFPSLSLGRIILIIGLLAKLCRAVSLSYHGTQENAFCRS